MSLILTLFQRMLLVQAALLPEGFYLAIWPNSSEYLGLSENPPDIASLLLGAGVVAGLWLTLGTIALWQVGRQRDLNRWQQIQTDLEFANAELQREIRDRQQAEVALKSSATRLSLALKAAKAGIWQWDQATNQAIWSEENFRLLGYDPQTDEAKYDNWLQAVHPDDREAANHHVVNVLAEQSDLNIEYRVLLPDGSIRWIADIGEITYDDDGAIEGMIGIQIDITARKQAELALQQLNQELESRIQQRTTALQQSEERLRLALEAVSMGVWEINLRTGQQIWSPQTEAIWGLAPGTFDGTMASVLSQIHPDDRNYVEQASQAALRTGHYHAEYRIVLPDQTIRWLSNRAKVFYDDAGNPLRMIGIDLDVTDRKQADVALRQSEEYYRQLAEDTPALICKFLPDSTLTYVNSTYCEYFNKRPDELLGCRFLEFLPEAERQAAQAHYMALTPNAPTLTYEHSVVQPDGREGWQQWVDRAFFDEQGQIISFQSIGFDITTRKRLEQEQATLTTILEATSDYIGTADPEGNVLWFNDQFKQLLPDSSEADRHQWRIAALHPQWASEIILSQGLPAAVRNGTWLGETALLDLKTGREIPVSQLIIAHKSDRADVSYYSTIMRDISDRKAAEKTLQQQAKQLEQVNQQLEDYSQTLEQRVEERTAELRLAQERIIAQEKLASLGTLTAGVAHELRNPLNFVKNYAEGSIDLIQELLETVHPLVRSQPPATVDLIQSILEDLQDNATSIRNHSQRAEQIIATMMAQTQTNNEKSLPQPTPLHDFLNQAVTLAYHSKRMQDNGFNLTIDTAYDPNIDLVDIIPGTFIRAIINLIDNAYDAMRHRQHPRRTDAPKNYTPILRIATRLLANQVEICIRDNGGGIPPHIQPQILDPFFTTKAPGEGTGLGLALTHDIVVKQHQGALTIRSEWGEFTEVIITVPRHLTR